MFLIWSFIAYVCCNLLFSFTFLRVYLFIDLFLRNRSIKSGGEGWFYRFTLYKPQIVHVYQWILVTRSHNVSYLIEKIFIFINQMTKDERIFLYYKSIFYYWVFQYDGNPGADVESFWRSISLLDALWIHSETKLNTSEEYRRAIQKSSNPFC